MEETASGFMDGLPTAILIGSLKLSWENSMGGISLRESFLKVRVVTAGYN
jgi:hypothetical protein